MRPTSNTSIRLSAVNEHSQSARLLITPGEPAGIGADITLITALRDIDAELLVIADPDLLEERARQLNIDVKLSVVSTIEKTVGKHRAGQLNIMPVKMNVSCQAGKMDSRNSQYVLDCLALAATHCLDNNSSAMVTGPVHKGIINDAGIPFTGHTEYLADISHSSPVMMLATEQLRVALATTHLALREVSDAITYESLEHTIHTLHDFLKQRCAIEQPRLLVCGLNPHAGEDGHLGMEEIEIITPAIESARQSGIEILGPLPADTAFTKKYLEKADAILAMYHDQGLPVLKHSGFGKAVNITLGLPFIRTSVDHGTALELAGTGKADASSMLAAINFARILSMSQA